MHELYLRLEECVKPIKDDKVIADPGLGFYKKSWTVLGTVKQGRPTKTIRFTNFNRAALRKRMTVLNAMDNIEDRDKVTAKISVFCAEHNLWGVAETQCVA